MFLSCEVTVKRIFVGTEDATDVAPKLLLPSALRYDLLIGFVPLQKFLVPLALEMLLKNVPVVQGHSTETAVVLVFSRVSFYGVGAGTLMCTGIHLHKDVSALYTSIFHCGLMAWSFDVYIDFMPAENHITYSTSKNLVLGSWVHIILVEVFQVCREATLPKFLLMFSTSKVYLEGLHTGDVYIADLTGEVHLHTSLLVVEFFVFHHELKPCVLYFQWIHCFQSRFQFWLRCGVSSSVVTLQR